MESDGSAEESSPAESASALASSGIALDGNVTASATGATFGCADGPMTPADATRG